MHTVTARTLRFAAALTLGCVSSALAGPDVIVGDLPDISNYGVVGSKAVWAVGTTSCNLGDTPLLWESGTAQHPVISQNIYRLSNGRFQQLGQAWLKHGFCALQGTVCSPCTPGGSCPALYPGCSDPYSSGLNGSQSGLGPKAEVNAATATFPYPWINNGTGSGTAFKRLQAETSEMTTAGALYFVSSMYVSPDDAAAGNDNNNQTYRRVTVNSSTYNLTLVDTAQRQKPAILAWRDHGLGANVADPSVSIANVDVPSDGRFIVGMKAIALGGGFYRYEYAIQNFNSDRSSGSFSIPIPAGATVSNIGFSDVDYHSGEPYSLTNWTGAVSGGALTWSVGQTFAQNANANALRWDTIYNFWFTCDREPSLGTATIGLFKPGTPNSVTVGVNVPLNTGTPTPPPNDSCASATSIGSGSYNFATLNATTDGPNEAAACVIGGYTQIGSDVWFRYTSGPCAGTATVSLCGSNFDTKLAVYPGATCPTTGGTSIACNDDFACAGSATQSQLTFAQTPNTQYLIRVGGYNATTGLGAMTITEPTCGPTAPPNNACATPIAIYDNVPVNGDTTLATNDGTASCGATSASKDVWYTYTPATTALVNVNTCGSGFDTVVSVHTGACGALTQVACNDDNGGGGGNNACNGGLSSGINVNMTAGTTYRIRVGGYQTSSGTFTLRVIGGGGTPPPVGPANDSCTNRAGLGLGTLAFSTVNATTDGPTHTGCNFFGSTQIYNDIWYNHPSQEAGRLLVSTCSDANFDTKIALYRNAGCTDLDARLINCADDTATCNPGTTTQLVIPVGPGQNYTLRLGAYGANQSGTGNLTLTRFCVADTDDGSGAGIPDGGVGIEDLLYYLSLYDAGSTLADSDDGSSTGIPDGGVGIEDLLFYLERYDAGC